MATATITVTSLKVSNGYILTITETIDGEEKSTQLIATSPEEITRLIVAKTTYNGGTLDAFTLNLTYKVPDNGNI